MMLWSQVNLLLQNRKPNSKHLNYFSDKDLLAIWEFGLNHSVIETNLFLLSHAYPDYDISRIASFSIGERDARLLHIHEKLFGLVLYNTSNCTVCDQKMEWETSVDDIQLQSINEDETNPIDLNYKHHHVRFRLPNSRDILEINDRDPENDQVAQLVHQCIVESTLSEEQIKEIPDDLKHELILKMEENDPQANVIMNLSCSECDNKWEVTFDIMQYLWKEINDWAIGLLQDIYSLAINFGWSENDIIGMSRFRRNLYLNIINK